MSETDRLSDRDLLVEIHTTVKAQTNSISDHEIRLRRVEKILYIGIGLSAGAGSAVGSVLANFLG